MPKERNKADGYREKAYEGDTKAMNNLGVCYERGIGVKVNLEMAFEWYMKAINPPSTTARNTDINGIKLSNDDTEETENQVFGNILSLLVCLSGLSCGWNPEIPDIS